MAGRAARGRAIVTGMIATYAMGGVAWDYAQYALGLERLGFEVFYLEDTGWLTYDPVLQDYTYDPTYGVRFLAESLAALSSTLSERWCFRRMDGELIGPAASRWREILSTADIMINVSGSAVLRNEYMLCPRKVLIDTDPGYNQFSNYPAQDAFVAAEAGDHDTARRLLRQAGRTRSAEDLDGWLEASHAWRESQSFRGHDIFFTYAERIGRDGCMLPLLDLQWWPTRPVVIADAWRDLPPGDTWTTVMTWKNFQAPIRNGDRSYGAKEMEFGHIEALPERCRRRVEIAVSGDNAPVESWRIAGWSVTDAQSVSSTPAIYRDYIQRSRGELSVAKNIYVATRSGWFSCRSACYLAAGRPVVVQDTGFSDVLPTGQGVLSFSTLDEAVAAIETVESDYVGHQAAAREFARAYLEAGVVLGDMLKQAGVH